MHQFLIDHISFYYDPALIQSNHFTVNATPQPYSVTWNTNKDPFSTLMQQYCENDVLLIDSTVWSHYQPELAIANERIFIVEATENTKSLDSVKMVIDFLQKNKLSKKEKLIVVGGGITQDIGAFAAALYKRGIAWIYFPTTLLSMCDSCLGGKASLNYGGAKNQLGLFSKPKSIYINPYFLTTLNDTAIFSGLGEILKLCIIGGNFFLNLYKQHVVSGKVKSADDYHQLIFAALCVKKAIIEADEFEQHHRQSMNYGHTLGHAIESLSDYAISHGQAIVLGMILENKLSFHKKLLNESELNKLNALCFELIDDTVLSHFNKIPLEKMAQLVQQDKKTLGDQTTFTLMKTVGEICFVSLKIAEIPHNFQ